MDKGKRTHFYADSRTNEYYSIDADGNRTDYSDADEYANAFAYFIAIRYYYYLLNKRSYSSDIDAIPDAFIDAYRTTNPTTHGD
jgi:hypothetical protein